MAATVPQPCFIYKGVDPTGPAPSGASARPEMLADANHPSARSEWRLGSHRGRDLAAGRGPFRPHETRRVVVVEPFAASGFVGPKLNHAVIDVRRHARPEKIASDHPGG